MCSPNYHVTLYVDVLSDLFLCFVILLLTGADDLSQLVSPNTHLFKNIWICCNVKDGIWTQCIGLIIAWCGVFTPSRIGEHSKLIRFERNALSQHPSMDKDKYMINAHEWCVFLDNKSDVYKKLSYFPQTYSFVIKPWTSSYPTPCNAHIHGAVRKICVGFAWWHCRANFLDISRYSDTEIEPWRNWFSWRRVPQCSLWCPSDSYGHISFITLSGSLYY